MYTVSDNFHTVEFNDIIMALEYYDSLKGSKCNAIVLQKQGDNNSDIVYHEL